MVRERRMDGSYGPPFRFKVWIPKMPNYEGAVIDE